MSQETDKTAQARLLGDRPPQQIRVHLRPAEQLPTDEFSLSIWANTSWFINWVTQNHLEEITIPPCTQPKKPMRVHLWLTQEHLRFRYLPPIPSILTLFGQNLSINHQALLLNLSVNCWVELEELTHHTIRGKILSGSLQLTDLDQTVYAFAGLQNLIEQLWPDKSCTERVRAMILGRSSFQMEIATAVKRRRIVFLGKTQDMQVAGREGRLWQMIAPPDEIGSTEDYEVPSQQLEEILNTLRAATNQSNTPLSIRRGSTQGEEAGIFYHIIEIGDEVEKREIIKPDVDLVFRYAAGQTTWTPQTLRSEPLGNQTKRYELVDVDQVKWLKRGQFIALETESVNSTENASGKVFEVSWNQASIPSPQVTQLPAMCMTGTASQVTAGATVVWQFGQLQEDGVNRPANVPGWIRYQIDPVPMPSKSVERGLRRLDYLTGKFIFEQVQDWRWEVDLAQDAKGGSPQAFKSRLKAELTIISESEEQHTLTSLKLTIAEPEVRATTPNLHFFKAPGDRSLPDPKFLPNGKTLESVLVETALIFRTHDPSPTGIRLTLDGERRLTIGCDDNQVAAYIPTGQALIDPISPTGTNLVSTPSVSNDANPKQEISRDPNHGLVPVLLKQFYLDIPKDASELARLICPTGTSQEPDPKMKSVLALLPWVEWEGDSQTNTSLTLHHRNLVLEQDEFLSAKEDSGTITNLRFSFKDFVTAVRDRYTQASDSLRQTSRLKNWLPGAVLQDEGGNQLTPELTIDTDNTGLPRVKVALKSPSGELSQYLSLQTGESRLKTHESWLQFGLNWQGLSAEQAPIFKLKADTSASLINSAAPLVFDQSQRYVYDNLGVIRERLPALTESPWLIERIRYPQDSGTYQTVYSVSYFNSEEALIQSGDADENSTEISFTCAALKLQKDGTLVDADAPFSTARFELGSYGFFRTPTSPGWKDLDCWSRLAGMPIFVTKLLRLELEIDKPKTIQFQAVLVNPYDVAENYQPGQQAVPSFVGEAIARGSLLTITLTASGSTFELTEVTGNIDWTFSLTAQSPPLDPPGFPGRLARLVGTVKLEQGKLAIKPKPKKCQAYVFGQLWSLQECPTLVCTGNQTSITVQAIPSGDLTLTIACNAPQSGTLEFNLPVQIESPISGYDFKAAIQSEQQQSDDKSVKQLHLQLVSADGSVTLAFAAIVQGMYYGFFLEDPIDYKEENTPSYRFGRSLLVLWLESQTSDPKLGGVLIQEDAPEFAQLTLIAPSQAAVTPPQKMTLKGVRMRMQIVSSNPASPQQEILSWYLKNDSEKVSLHIGEQVVETPIDPSDSSPVNSRLTGYLVWKPESNESPEIQGPIVLQHYQNDEYEVIPAVYYAQRVNVEPESGTTQRDFSVPRLQPDTPSQDFDLVETSRTSSQENGFVKLRFNGTTFELAKLATGQVPIDLYLDQEFIQAIATLPLKVPQLIHREVYGARLRMAIADSEGIDSTYEFSDEAVPWSVTEHQWLLDPVVKDNQMSQIVLLQGSLFLKPGSGAQQQEFQTENLFVIQRPLELPDESMSAIARLPLTNLLSVTSRIPLDKADKGLSVFFDEQQVEDYLLKKGASGIAVHRLLTRKILQSDQEADRGLYRFMPSPFYAGSLTASASKKASEGVSLAGVFQPLTAEKLSNTPPSKHTQAATPLFLDLRLLLPQNLVGVQLELFSRYCPAQSLSTPSNQSSLPQRVIKFERNVPQPNTPDQLEHHIHALEATAFAQMEPLGFPPEFVTSNAEATTTFLPQNLELRYAADKPGAMFHNKLQAYTIPKSEAAVKVELMTDVALREPQQFKLPVGAAIEITDYEPKSLQTLKLTNMQFCNIKLRWKEVLGQVALKDLINQQPIAVKDDKLAAEPFKLIVQIEQSVQEIRRTDAVIPIADGTTSTTQQIYIVTRLQDLNLGIDLQRENEPKPAQYKLLFIKNDDKQLVSFETYFQKVEDVNTNPYIVWKYKDGGDWSGLTKLKAVWRSTAEIDEKPQNIPEIPYFEYQIQRIPPSGFSAKIAVIHSLRRKDRPNLERTLLFGNAASLDTGNFEIQEDEFQFSTYGEDTVDAIVNNLPDASEHLFLVKYLTEGQTLFTQR